MHTHMVRHPIVTRNTLLYEDGQLDSSLVNYFLLSLSSVVKRECGLATLVIQDLDISEASDWEWSIWPARHHLIGTAGTPTVNSSWGLVVIVIYCWKLFSDFCFRMSFAILAINAGRTSPTKKPSHYPNKKILGGRLALPNNMKVNMLFEILCICCRDFFWCGQLWGIPCWWAVKFVFI